MLPIDPEKGDFAGWAQVYPEKGDLCSYKMSHAGINVAFDRVNTRKQVTDKQGNW